MDGDPDLRDIGNYSNDTTKAVLETLQAARGSQEWPRAVTHGLSRVWRGVENQNFVDDVLQAMEQVGRSDEAVAWAFSDANDDILGAAILAVWAFQRSGSRRVIQDVTRGVLAKGLLSSKVGDSAIFKQMLADLRSPAISIEKGRSGPRYFLYSLVKESGSREPDGDPVFEPGDFVIKCEDYGIPQSRHRLILLGVREDLAVDKIPVLMRSVKPVGAGRVLQGLPRLRSGLTKVPDGRSEWRDVLQGILCPGILDDLPNGHGRTLRRDIEWTLKRLRMPRADRGGEFVACEAKSEYEPKWYCDTGIGGACNHASRPHMPQDLQRYLFVACYARVFGRSPELRDFPRTLLPKHKNVKDEKKKEYFDDRFRVQLANKPSTTVTSHMAKDGHYFIHYDEKQCRSLTVREAARLQTFPDNYFFCGTRTQQYVQVGNAVPPLLARQVAGIVFKVLRGKCD